MIKEGAMEGVTEVYGMHNWPGGSVGTLGTIAGPMMAHVTEFVITVSGRGGHASQPQALRDPVVAACQVVVSLQTVVSRNLHPKDFACVSVTCVHGGEAMNVTPDIVTIRGTTRDFSEDVFAIIKSRMEEIVEHTCKSFGCTSKFEWLGTEYSALHNTPAETEHVLRVARAVLGEENVSSEGLPVLAAEDFGYFTRESPGCFFMLGNGGSGSGPIHTSDFDFNDKLIPVAIKFWTALVEDRLGVSLTK
jgi:hippurate hydrolase